MKVFDFDADTCAKDYAKNGYIHITDGVTPEFVEYARAFTKAALAEQERTSLQEWRFANKKTQFLFEFPDTTDFVQEVKSVIAGVAGVGVDRVTLCERHIKVYDDNAQPNPPPHKDRLASEITVGIPLEVPDNSYLILYPDHQRYVNPFSTTALYRSSLDDDQLPEVLLQGVEPQKLFVWPGDVVMFKGSEIYHERVNPANTILLYIKFNTMKLDPIGEDPWTQSLRQASNEKLLNRDDDSLVQSRVMVSPQLEKISRHYTRYGWKEVVQAYVWGEKEVTIGEFELRFIKSAGGDDTISGILQKNKDSCTDENLAAVKRLIRLGVLNLL